MGKVEKLLKCQTFISNQFKCDEQPSGDSLRESLQFDCITVNNVLGTISKMSNSTNCLCVLHPQAAFMIDVGSIRRH